MKKFPLILACAAEVLCWTWSTQAIALSAKNFQGECIGKYRSWKRQEGFGAAAISKNGRCGFSWGYSSAAQARAAAISACRSVGKAKGCAVIVENRKLSAKVNPANSKIKGTGETQTLAEFQAKYKLSKKAMQERFGAVGRITCPWATATTFLISQSDIFITSDHVFLSPEKKAAALGRPENCYIEFFYSKQRYRLKSAALVHGFRTNKSAYKFDWFDWAIGKIDRPVEGAQPFTVMTDHITKSMDILMVSQGINDFVSRICIGQVSYTLDIASVTDFTTNCDTGPGASGGPVIAGGIDGVNGNRQMAAGVTRGYTVNSVGYRPDMAHVAIPTHDPEIEKAIILLQGKEDAQQ